MEYVTLVLCGARVCRKGEISKFVKMSKNMNSPIIRPLVLRAVDRQVKV